MKREALAFDQSSALQATAPPEDRSLARDEVRLLVSTPEGHHHAHFYDLLLPG